MRCVDPDVSASCDDLRMCRICEGFSLDDVLALDAARIAEYGFVLIGVAGRDGDPEDLSPWAYTVGLLDAADHPEMIIAGVSNETSQSVLSMLARSVLDGEYYDVGDTIDLGRGVARVGAVDAVQYELDTFNMWHNLRAYGTLRTAELEAVQIILPPTFFCSAHGDSQPLLDEPGARVGLRSVRPNRAERRRRPRSRRYSA
jgi:hypothetical protein